MSKKKCIFIFHIDSLGQEHLFVLRGWNFMQCVLSSRQQLCFSARNDCARRRSPSLWVIVASLFMFLLCHREARVSPQLLKWKLSDTKYSSLSLRSRSASEGIWLSNMDVHLLSTIKTDFVQYNQDWLCSVMRTFFIYLFLGPQTYSTLY